MVKTTPNQWRKREFEKKKIEKIHTLRKYAKLLKKENITDSSRIKINSNDQQNDAPQPERRPPSGKKKPHFNKYQVEATSNPRETQAEERQQREEERIKKMQESIKRRKEERKVLSLKTKKGQPVLKGHIQKMLGKLMKEKENN
jgi:hypothetical protein